jgi:cysteate synthase
LLIVPGKGLHRLKFRTSLNPCVTLVVIDDGDYTDAIELATAISRTDPFYLEGGIKNVGRRDGLGTVLLAAFEEMGLIPSYYFQAVGSGTGAVAVLEAASRLCEASVGLASPRLMMCQNSPFTPIYSKWRQAPSTADGAVTQIYADELANRTPPYEIRGGVRDSLRDSQGEVLVADNAAVAEAMRMFNELEGIDIEPAAGVAVACLIASVAEGKLADEVVLVNITGGGRGRLAKDHSLYPAAPQMRLTREALGSERTAREIAEVVACQS